MKRIALILLWLAALALFAAIPTAKTIRLNWQYPATNLCATNLEFRIYSSPTLTVPLTNWVMVKTVVGTNLSTTLTVTPGVAFYYVTAYSKWWEIESDPSNVEGTPPVPLQGVLGRPELSK